MDTKFLGLPVFIWSVTVKIDVSTSFDTSVREAVE